MLPAITQVTALPFSSVRDPHAGRTLGTRRRTKGWSVKERPTGDDTTRPMPVPGPRRTEQDTDSGSWRTMHHHLFGGRRQREAEARLVSTLTQLHSRLAAAGSGGANVGLTTSMTHPDLESAASESAQKRDASHSAQSRDSTLKALVDGANSLLLWHHEQLQAARIIGDWDHPVPETARQILDVVRQRHPLFEMGQASDINLDLSDIVQSVGQARGADGEAYYEATLLGLTFILREAVKRLEIDAPTASTALAVQDTWGELIAEVEGLLAAPVPVFGKPAAELAAPTPARLEDREEQRVMRFSRLELVAL